MSLYEHVMIARQDLSNTQAEALIEHFGFDESRIEVLTDSQATRAAVLASLNRLVDTAKRNDIVYIHFSGHCSRVRDQNDDEEDELD